MNQHLTGQWRPGTKIKVRNSCSWLPLDLVSVQHIVFQMLFGKNSQMEIVKDFVMFWLL